ncbi:MAG: copper transporter [Actinomycetota bacterium]
MISFRYHIVSLMAVFLALAVGIIAGSTVVDQQLIKGLQRQRNIDAAIKEELRQEADVLRAEVALWKTYGDELLLPSMRGTLNGVDVALVVPPFVPDDTRVAVRDGLRIAGATISGELRLKARILIPDETSAQQLALAIEAGDERGDELLASAGRVVGGTFGPSLLDRWTSGALVDADMIEVAERGPARARPQVVIILWDATLENERLAGTLLPAMLSAALEAGAKTVLAEPLAQEPSMATRVLDNDALRNGISTVDHAATTLGSVALAAATRSLVREGAVHHYGVRPGTEGALPTSSRQPPGGLPPPPTKPPIPSPRPTR